MDLPVKEMKTQILNQVIFIPISSPNTILANSLRLTLDAMDIHKPLPVPLLTKPLALKTRFTKIILVILPFAVLRLAPFTVTTSTVFMMV